MYGLGRRGVGSAAGSAYRRGCPGSRAPIPVPARRVRAVVRPPGSDGERPWTRTGAENGERTARTGVGTGTATAGRQLSLGSIPSSHEPSGGARWRSKPALMRRCGAVVDAGEAGWLRSQRARAALRRGPPRPSARRHPRRSASQGPRCEPYTGPKARRETPAPTGGRRASRVLGYRNSSSSADSHARRQPSSPSTVWSPMWPMRTVVSFSLPYPPPIT